MLMAKDDDFAKIKHFTREWTADDDALSVLNVYAVNTELVGGPAHCPSARVVASDFTRNYLSNRTYNQQINNIRFYRTTLC